MNVTQPVWKAANAARDSFNKLLLQKTKIYNGNQTMAMLHITDAQNNVLKVIYICNSSEENSDVRHIY